MTSQVREFFAEAGPLSRVLRPYEPRASQVEVAEAVAEALASSRKLVAEAGTGTGKTLAYLVPALQSGLKVLISTGTKNLQDQLIFKDLPVVKRALGRPFTVEVMKGRANYLCELRAETAFAQGMLPTMPGAADLSRLRIWREETQSGDRAELTNLADDAPIWRQVSSTSEQCVGRTCAHYDRCWVTQMRRRAQLADVVVVNHHLYLADAALRQSVGDEGVALLPPHDVVIFDEAHELDEIAAHHFGHQVAERRLADLEQDVYHGLGEHGLVRQRLAQVFSELRRAGRELFDELPFELGRVRLQDGFLNERAQGHHLEADQLLQQIESELAAIPGDETKPLARRAATLAAELSFVLGCKPRASLVADVTLPGQLDRADSSGTDAAPPWVRYCEATSRQRTLVARPVDVAPALGRLLARTPAVFVSATLRVGRSFGHFRRRVGLGEVTELCVDSPFAYATQACLYLPRDLPEPEQAQFGAAAAQRVAELVQAAGGGAFVLCTSLRALQQMRAAVRGLGVGPVLMQGEAPKTQLVDTFRKAGNAVLVATMSFWKGVDVPGDALRLVIMDKLPFASPADPVVEARMEYLSSQGLDPFMTYQVPQAALLLRQGFGRLIRRQTDRGMVAILDARLSTRRYGPLLLQGLPRCRRIFELDEAIDALTPLQPAQNSPRTPKVGNI